MLLLKEPRSDRKAPEGVSIPDWRKVSKNFRKALVEALVAQKWPLVIRGVPGVGKSCAMACVFRSWPRHALWRDCGQLLTRITSCRTSKNGSVSVSVPGGGSYEEFEGSICRKWAGADLVCLDDVGVRTPSDAQREIFNHLIDLRREKPTILTTNLDYDQFKNVFDERIFSRVFCGSVINVTGEDRRFENVMVREV